MSQLDCKIEFAKNIQIKKIDERKITFMYWRDNFKNSHSAQSNLRSRGFRSSQQSVRTAQRISQNERLSQMYSFIFASFFSQIAFETKTETQDHIQNPNAIIKKKIGNATPTAASASDEIAQAK